MTAQGQDLIPLTSADYSMLTSEIATLTLPSSVEVKRKSLSFFVFNSFQMKTFVFKDAAYAFTRDFNAEDIVCVNLFPTSVDIWQASKPIRVLVAENLNSSKPVSVRFSYTITRNPPNQDDSEDIAAVVTANRTVTIEADEIETRKLLKEILQFGNSSANM